jgi:glycosyltransferase involved in cell wall biosynthesis
VAVVIPVFNSAGTLARAIESVFSQNPLPDQVIVVDDGSTDDIAAALQQFGTQVECVRQSNRGPSAARNNGMARARTDTVMFLDADDFLLPGALAIRLSLLEEPHVAWAHTDGFLQDQEGGRRLFSAVYPLPVECTDGRILRHLLCRNFISTDAVIARRSVLLEVGAFDESLRWMEDWDLWLRLAVRYPGGFSATPTFVQQLAPNSLSSNRDAMIRMRYHVLVKFQQLFPRAVCTAGQLARRSVADAHNRFGFFFAETGRWGQARPLLWTSVRLWPAQRRVWWLLMRCLAHAHCPGGPSGSYPRGQDSATGATKE